MKKLLILLVVFAVILSGCLGQDGNGEDEIGRSFNTEGSSDVQLNRDDVFLKIEGQWTFYLDMSREEVLKQIGEPLLVRERSGTNIYEVVTIDYENDKVIQISGFSTNPDDVITDRGVKIGTTLEQVKDVYGEQTITEYMQPEILQYRLDRDGEREEDTWLLLTIRDNKVADFELFYGGVNEWGMVQPYSNLLQD